MHWLDSTWPRWMSFAERTEYRVPSYAASSRPIASCSPDCPAPRLRHLGADAAEVDHGAATALHHVWFHRLQHHDAAHDINVVAVQPVFARRIESVVHINARQVNQNIDATELCHRFIHAGGDLGIVCQVSLHELDVLTERTGNCLSIFVVDV